MATAALSAFSLPLTVTLGALAIIIFPWLVRLPRLAISFLFLSLLTGQLIRFPLPGQGGGILPSDLAVVAVLLSAVTQIILNHQAKKNKTSYPKHSTPAFAKAFAPGLGGPSKIQSSIIFWLLTPFIAWSLYTLVLHAPGLGPTNTLIAFSYWLRLTANLLLLPALIILFQQPISYQPRSSSPTASRGWRSSGCPASSGIPGGPAVRRGRRNWSEKRGNLLRQDPQQQNNLNQTVLTLGHFAWHGLRLVILLLVLIGLAQLFFLPDLSVFARAGWDPHQFRLVSTWLDPNFFGVFLVLVLPFVLMKQSADSKPPYDKGDKGGFPTNPRLVVALLVVFALIATQSRSALVAAALSALLLSPLLIYIFSRRLPQNPIILLSLLGLTITFSAVLFLMLGPRLAGLITIDPTVELRLANLAGGWQIARDNSLVGVGYNAYQFAAVRANLISDYSIHSRAGADNSLLTLWATTGLIGVILFLLPWTYLLHLFLTRTIIYRAPLALAGLFSLTTLLLHSQFINSFLYSHLLITLAIIASLTLTRT